MLLAAIPFLAIDDTKKETAQNFLPLDQKESTQALNKMSDLVPMPTLESSATPTLTLEPIPTPTLTPTSTPTPVATFESTTIPALAFERPKWDEAILRDPVRRIIIDQPLVGLTIDDGYFDLDETLDILIEKKASATFFVLGGNLQRNPKFVLRALDAGYEFGNHTYSHRSLTALAGQDVEREITRPEEVLKQISKDATTVPFFRPPGGAYNSQIVEIAAKLGFRTILWNVSGDAGIMTADQLTAWYLDSLDKVKPKAWGSIILMHFQPKTLKLLPAVIDGLRKNEIEPVSLSRLFSVVS